MSGQGVNFANHFNVSRETIKKLEIYAALLRKWTRRINLVAPATVDALWDRHFLDSAQILSLAPAAAQKWTDIGSGGGFPGAVVALMAEASHPELRVTLIESDQRKATFLRAISRETDVKFSVLAERSESVTGTAADVVSARALARLDTLLGYVVHHISPGGIALLPKGANSASEVESARKTWSFTCESIPSMTDNQAAILKIGDIRRV